jgi:hypothetical protein
MLDFSGLLGVFNVDKQNQHRLMCMRTFYLGSIAGLVIRCLTLHFTLICCHWCLMKALHRVTQGPFKECQATDNFNIR